MGGSDACNWIIDLENIQIWSWLLNDDDFMLCLTHNLEQKRRHCVNELGHRIVFS